MRRELQRSSQPSKQPDKNDDKKIKIFKGKYFAGLLALNSLM
jgi:hypothetical protein